MGLRLATNDRSAQGIGAIETLTCGRALPEAARGCQRGPLVQELSKVGSGIPLARS